MTYSPRIQDAIRLATDAHTGQIRKGKPSVPYIVHPLAVALILSQARASEAVIVAGILHDIVEDTEVELKDLRSKFGDDVAELVKSVTEEDKSLPWEERKRIALSHIKGMNREALLLKSADILANLADTLDDVGREGDKVFERFGAPKEKQIERYRTLVHELEKAWPENPLLGEIRSNVKRLTQRV